MLVVTIFVVGYLAIVFEHQLGVNKSATALLAGVLCWTAHVAGADRNAVNDRLLHHFGELSQILFFLLAAMTIVELIDAHDGFDLLTARIRTTNRRKLLFTVAGLTFFLSAALDNLTTAILMMSVLRKLAADREDRTYYGGIVIIAANAGGVWSPIGDVTTTMLWIGHQATAVSIVTRLILPALVSVVVPTVWIALRLKGNVRRPGGNTVSQAASADAHSPHLVLAEGAATLGKSLSELDLRARTGALVLTIAHAGGLPSSPSPLEPLTLGDELAFAGPPEAIARARDLLVLGRVPKARSPFERALVLCVGLGVLLAVPLFRAMTDLPPVMGILLGLGALWSITEITHKQKNDEERASLSVAGALQRIDAQSVLFFLGILLAVSALESNGSLAALAHWLDKTIGNTQLMTILIGLSSSVVDNVPLVAAAQGMYGLETFPTDHDFWLFLTYCSGTGGSILIIGSAAGIAVMGIERISFGSYLRTHALPALLGYAAGAAAYLVASIGMH